MNRVAKLKTWYSIHKWISLVTGIIIVMWLITGIAITAPDLLGYTWPTNHYQANSPNFRTVHMSPARAVAQLTETLGKAPTVSEITLVPIRDIVVYRILVDDQVYLIDTATGKNFTLTEDLAQQIAHDAIGVDAPLLSISRLEQHDAAYLYGSVPAYRLAFGNTDQTYVYVATETAEVYVDDQISRWIMFLGALHTFHIGDTLLPDREQLVTILLWLASILTGLAALIGYYLALPRRWQLWHR